MKMKTVLTVVLVVLVVCFGTSCKSGDKLDIKTAEEKIAADINRILEEEMADLGLSGVKLKEAPKKYNASFIGTVTYISGSGNFDREILANYDSDTITWWFSNDPEDTFLIFIGEPVYQMADESPGYYPEEPVQPAIGTGNRQTTNTQPTVTLGRVEQTASGLIKTFNTEGRFITSSSSAHGKLVGWGKDFFVTRTEIGGFFTYDQNCKSISKTTVPGATTVTVDRDSFTVRTAYSSHKFNRSCRSF
jgi:hypothetical protein